MFTHDSYVICMLFISQDLRFLSFCKPRTCTACHKQKRYAQFSLPRRREMDAKTNASEAERSIF